MTRSIPTVAVVVPTYNRASLVTQTLDSVIRQTRPADRIVVVDDGSADNTAAAVEHYRPRVDYLHQPNGGKSAALNHALSTLDAGYVWIIDDDDLMHPRAIERHLSFLSNHPQFDFCYGSHYLFKGMKPPAVSKRLSLCDCSGIEPLALLIACLETFTFSMSSMLVPLRCYRRAGPFDEALKRGQDYEMILRITRLFRGGYVPEPALLVRRHRGERGPATERHAALHRDVVWRKYEQRTFSEIRATLALREYLPAGSATGDLTPQLERQALLQRACIMARHGMFDHALRDLQLAAAQPLDSMGLTQTEQMICARMLNLEPAILKGRSAFLAAIKQLSRQGLPGLRERGMAGLYWGMRREISAKRCRGAAQMASHFIRLASPHFSPAFVASRFKGAA